MNLKVACKNNKSAYVGLAITLLFTLAVFLYFGSQKRISFCDEFYTYTITNSDMFILQFDENVWYDRTEILDKLTHTDSDSFGQMIDWIKLDAVHPPFYYLFIYAASCIAGATFTKWVGLGVNLISLMGTVVFLWLILYRLFHSTLISSLGIIGYVLNQSTISDATLIRMYMMFTFFTAAFMFFTLCIMQCDKKSTGSLKKAPDKYGYYIALMFVTCGGFLTQYYFAIFAFLGFVLFAAMSLPERKYKETLWYFAAMVGAVVLSTVFWSFWIHAVRANGHSGAMGENLRNFFDFERLFDGYRIAMASVFQWGYHVGMWLVPILVAIFFLVSSVFRKEDKAVRKFVLLIATLAFLYSVIVRGLTPDYLKSTRYFYAADMLFVLLIAVTVLYITGIIAGDKAALKKIIMSAMCLILGVSSYLLMVNGFGIDYFGDLQLYNEQKELLSEYADCPLIIVGSDDWMTETYIEDFALFSSAVRIDENTERIPDERLDNAKQIVLFVQKLPGDEDEEYFSKLNDKMETGQFYAIVATQKWYSAEHLMDKEYMSVYVLTRDENM